MSVIGQKLGSVLFVLLFFLIWELACIAFHISDLVLPRPSAILVVLYTKGAAIWPHALATLIATCLGFIGGVLCGIVLGVVIALLGGATIVVLNVLERRVLHWHPGARTVR